MTGNPVITVRIEKKRYAPGVVKNLVFGKIEPIKFLIIINSENLINEFINKNFYIDDSKFPSVIYCVKCRSSINLLCTTTKRYL